MAIDASSARDVLSAARRALLDRLRPSKRLRMVGWYDPRVLAQTAVFMTIANVFGRHSDTRLIEALASQPQHEFAFDADPVTGDFWLDYVSDVADGWNPTYAIAAAVAEGALSVESSDGTAPVATRGGDVLVFGGDEVYPYPSKEAYETRTENPYATAFAGARRWPTLFAVPGNHDWYDSLIAFSRMFCRPERGFAGCPTRQTRSYFALKLPHDWWLLAVDLQLGADLDEPQVRYFQDVATRMSTGARVILCVPDPQWIYERSYPGNPSYADATLRFFQSKILQQRRVAIHLTGDLHFYKRHEDADGVQKIVSGGGGAFLHPTHAPETAELRGGFREKACYPPMTTSARLTWKNLAFPLINPKYLYIPAVLYTLTAWLASATLAAPDLANIQTAFLAAVRGLRDPFSGLWLLMFVTAFVFFTDTHVRWYRVLGGIGHALSHLCAAFALGWLTILLTTRVLELPFGSIPQMLVSAAILFVGGGVVGAFVLGAYLFLSLWLFGRHSNEAFSSLRIQDYKQWLRLRIDASGALTAFAIAIDRVPRRWRETEADEGPQRVVGDDPRATPPRLIDRFTLSGVVPPRT